MSSIKARHRSRLCMCPLSTLKVRFGGPASQARSPKHRTLAIPSGEKPVFWAGRQYTGTMRVRLSPAWFALIFAVACGGEVRQSADATAGHSNAGSPAGGSSSASESGAFNSIGGADDPTGGASPTNCDNAEAPSLPAGCVLDCSVDREQAASLECVAGVWQCPAGLVPIHSCPLGTCSRRYETSCCDGATGHGASADCGADGLVHCAPGLRAMDRGARCLPESVKTTSCQSLIGMSCPSLDSECHEGLPCGATNCTCATDDAAHLVWQCAINPC